MAKQLITIAAAFATLAAAGVAQAAPPALLTVGHQNRHPAATFSAPGADSGTIYIATKPDRGTDGRFLDENIKRADFLSADELQRGTWLDSDQLEPGLYFVLLRAWDYHCRANPSCIDGFSNVVTLAVAKPRSTYRGRVVAVLRYSGLVHLRLTVRPLGEQLPYRVCWRLRSKRRACTSGEVRGYSWNSTASDTVTVNMRGMAPRTTFTWYVKRRAVATKTVGTTRA